MTACGLEERILEAADRSLGVLYRDIKTETDGTGWRNPERSAVRKLSRSPTRTLTLAGRVPFVTLVTVREETVSTPQREP